MSNFLIFKAAFNNSATPAIGTYTVEGGTAYFKTKTSLSPDYYMYVKTAEKPIKWFVPTTVVTDFEFVCDILTRDSDFGIAPYFTIADSNGVTKLRMESQYSNIRFMSDDTHGQSPSVICLTSPTDIGGYDIFHQFRIRIRKLTDSSSSVEVYANDNLVTSGTSPALITCGKISFLGATGAFVTNNIGVKNAYVYDLSGGDVIDRGVLSGAFNRFISWMKSKFALKSDIPTVNDATLTIQQNGTNVQTFTANQSTNATANIQCVDLTSAQTIGGDKDFTGTTGTRDVIPATTDTYDLGSSAAQWNNAYIKSLTINGVACGDILTHNVSEFVDVSSDQTINGSKYFTSLLSKSNTLARGSLPTTSISEDPIFIATDKNNRRTLAFSNYYFTNGDGRVVLYVYNQNTTDYDNIGLAFNFNNTNSSKSMHPFIDNTCSLGVAFRRWKDLYTNAINGLNPGALSLPNITGLINVASSITILDGSEVNTFTPQVNGWLLINGTGVANDAYIYVVQGRIGMMSSSNASMNRCAVLIPVVAGVEVSITCKLSTLTWANLVPCQGNV